jgi:hypothetical protein
MHADSYYEIGSSHVACEDYALSGTKDGLSWAIVSDGCSSSKHTDVGARILAHTAKDVLLRMYVLKRLTDKRFMEDGGIESEFYDMVLERALAARASLRLDYDVFDATLLTAFAVRHPGEPDPVWGAFAIGDGSVVVRHASGFHDVRLSYQSNAPYYISYRMCKEKDEGYRQSFGPDRRLVVTQTYHGDDGVTEQKEWYNNPYLEYSYSIGSTPPRGWPPTLNSMYVNMLALLFVSPPKSAA